MTKLELIEKRNQIQDKIDQTINTAESETRMLNEIEESTLVSLKNEIEDINEQMRNLEKENEKLSKQEKNNKKEVRTMENKFSILKAINDVAEGRQLDEATQEMITRAKVSAKGVEYQGQIVLPVNEERTLTAGTNTEVVAEDKLNILAALRNKSVLAQAGATILTGLKNNISIPSYSGSAVTWEGEIAEAKDGAGTFKGTKYAPKRLTAKLDVSKLFLIQDSVGAEQMLMNDISAALMEKLESTLLGSEAGTEDKPAGIFNIVAPMESVNDYEGIVGMETKLEENKVLGDYKFVVAPSVKGAFKTTAAFAGGNTPIMTGNEIDGIVVESTGNVPQKHFVLGKWEDYVITQFGGIDLTVDAVSQAANGVVRIVINGYFDAKPRRNESFVTAKTIANA